MGSEVFIVLDESSSRVITGTYEWDSSGGGVLIPPSGSSFPGTPTAKELFWRSDEGKLYRRNDGNTAWDLVVAEPDTHGSTHQSGGADSIKLDDLASPDDNTDLDASSSAHGLLPKLSNDSNEYLNGAGSWAEPETSLWAYRKTGTTDYECWYPMQHTGYPMTSGTMVADRLYAFPFHVPKSITLDRIAFNVSTGSSGNARLGIYDNDNCTPSDLILDAGEISTTASGTKKITINQALTPGLKWLALVSDATPVVRSLDFGTVVPILGYGSSLGVTAQIGVYSSYTYAALPDPFPSSPTINISFPLPAIFVRLSA